MDNKELIKKIYCIEEMADKMDKIDVYAELLLDGFNHLDSKEDLNVLARVALGEIKKLNRSAAIWIAARNLINKLESEPDAPKSSEEKIDLTSIADDLLPEFHPTDEEIAAVREVAGDD